jgi:hypothetical protein
MKILETFKEFNFKESDKVLVHYWWNHMITPVIILKKEKNRFLISHNIEESKISNAPEQWIKSYEIIDFFKKKN